ncbi:unnamed protein product [marine sediment metagenome]|uniref:Uncharacterized protein n=1 Tax=marine sediment metagenome TaxID=412755 RepID=X1VXP6_9ZZZZ
MAEKEQAAEVAEKEEKQEESVKAKPSNELKVVIILKDSRVMLGVQSPDCDPVYTTLKGTLAAALKRVPKLVEEAKQKWSASPLNPNANLPKPEPTPARTPAAAKKPTGQPSFF